VTAPERDPLPPPDPLTEEPLADRYCDLVLNGGVASGVVYPWALLELARHYRFKCIGGNSVGAMAAAVAAAAEFGRCIGVADAFEPLRKFPLKLAEEERGRPKMLRLFQPHPSLRRLFEVFLSAVREDPPDDAEDNPPPGKPPAATERGWATGWTIVKALNAYGVWFAALVLLGLGAWALWPTLDVWCGGTWLLFLGLVVLVLAGSVFGGLMFGVYLLYRDLRVLARNHFGMCTGLGQEGGGEGLVEWLHKGIQLAAGRKEQDLPLTFADLWAAPRGGRPGPSPLAGGLQPREAGINLQMFASNVTLGRPVRLPLDDPNTRLFYLPSEWEAFFPKAVLAELHRASSPYLPASPSDPPCDPPPDSLLPNEAIDLLRQVRELPSGGMPIVVAARLSLSFPFLFSCVPVYAIDHEVPLEHRRLRRCLLSDGGLCTNFPVHLFDSAHPRWPTFAFLLDSRLTKHGQAPVWLPEGHLEGRSDNWQRSVPGAEEDPTKERKLVDQLLGLAGGLLLTMKDWNDRVTGRLPQVRNRIVRLALRKGEGQLNLGMSRGTILRMAHLYGTMSGRELVKRYAPDGDGIRPAWREHLYVRSIIELRALRGHVRRYGHAVSSRGDTEPLAEVLARAVDKEPLLVLPGRPDPTARRLSSEEAASLQRASEAVKALETSLTLSGSFGPYDPVPEPELRLRPPV
jgi:predicted acylesterase/phospholipase RssA